MPVNIDDSTQKFIREHRIAHLATADIDGRPSVIPICYAFDGESIFSPVDEKAKSVEPIRLKRVENIVLNGHVSLVIDDYSEDWSRLTYVLISGVGFVYEPEGQHATKHARGVSLLREKYPQYRTMSIDKRLMIVILPIRIKTWSGIQLAD